MTKLSQLFVRKPLSHDDGVLGDAPREPSIELESTAPEAILPETDVEISTRIGEACEALRNLIVEAGTKVNELEDTKNAFFNLVDPVDQALRTLEQEKTRNITLTRRFDQLRSVHGTLQSKLDEAEKRIEAIGEEKHDLRLDLEQ